MCTMCALSKTCASNQWARTLFSATRGWFLALFDGVTKLGGDYKAISHSQEPGTTVAKVDHSALERPCSL